MTKSHTEKSGKLLPYIYMFTFIAGITAGALFARLTTGVTDLNITTASRMSVFFSSFKSFLKPCLIIWISGFTPVSIYLSSGMLAYRGVVFGFATGCIIKNYGIGGALCATLPQNIIFFPFLLLVSLIAAGRKKDNHTGYLTMLLMIICICALSALIDTHITSMMIKLIL